MSSNRRDILQKEQNLTSNDVSDTSSATEYSKWSTPDLVNRITHLETQLREQQSQLSNLLNESKIQPDPVPLRLSKSTRKPRPPPKNFDFASHPTRHIALKFSYLGSYYNCFEHANGTVTPLPTVEEVLWKALTKSRLIDPPVPEESDEKYDVVWDTKTRWRLYGNEDGKKRLDVIWDGCEYSKCGRTDRGVSAFGQVVALRVRSRIKSQMKKAEAPEQSGQTNGDSNTIECHYHSGQKHLNVDADAAPANELESEPEIPYAVILNSILPPHLRVHAVCLDPPSDFDARFSCTGREYRYFFTNPAFCPDITETSQVFRSEQVTSDGLSTKVSSPCQPTGWLDISEMRRAAQKFQGLHDFRNFCKIDPSKAITSDDHGNEKTMSFLRRIRQCDVIPISDPLVDAFTSPLPRSDHGSDKHLAQPDGVQTYAFVVHGSAFLWHQVRCMVAILFLIGQGLESPQLIDRMLDVHGLENRGRGRPEYLMAAEEPLVLWDCNFGRRRTGKHLGGDGESAPAAEEVAVSPPDDSISAGAEDEPLKWTPVGDPSTRSSLALYAGAGGRDRSDGLSGPAGLAEETWALWRHAKIEEVLRREVLGLVLDGKAHGDGEDGGKTSVRDALDVHVGGGPLVKQGGKERGRERTRIFDGADRGRNVGRYVSVMERPRLDTPEVQGRKFAQGKGRRKALKAGLDAERDG